MRTSIPIKTIAEPLNDAFEAVDAMWRIELVGGPELVQLWRIARGKLLFARDRMADLTRMASYLAATNGSPIHSSDPSQPEPTPEIRPDRATDRPSEKVSHRKAGRTPSRTKAFRGRN